MLKIERLSLAWRYHRSFTILVKVFNIEQRHVVYLPVVDNQILVHNTDTGYCIQLDMLGTVLVSIMEEPINSDY